MDVIVFHYYCRLYSTCSWEDRAIRKLIGNGKLAGRQKGLENRNCMSYEECPICFLYYNKLNITDCCKAFMCSECYLQVRPQNVSNQNSEVTEDVGACPFCNTPKFTIKIATLTSEAAVRREEEEKKAIEACKNAEKIRSKSFCSEATVSSNGDALCTEANDKDDTEESKQQQDNEITTSAPEFSPLVTKVVDSEHFGSSLEKDLARRRTLSNMSDTSGGLPGSPKSPEQNHYVVSVEDRMKLEEEMKKQIYHPLTRQAVAESTSSPANQSSRSNRGIIGLRRRLRPNSSGRVYHRDLGHIIEAIERDRGDFQSLDDLVFLETAILLSMEEQTRLESGAPADSDTSQEISSPNTNGGSNNLSALLRRHRINTLNPDHESRNQRLSRLRGINAFDNRGLYMRGISEDDQVAMAIALSLRDMESGNDEEGNQAQETVRTQVSSGEMEEGENTVSNNEAYERASEAANTQPVPNRVANQSGHDESHNILPREETRVSDFDNNPANSGDGDNVPGNVDVVQSLS